MKLRLLDILVCPNDKAWPLKIYTFEERKLSDVKLPIKNDLTKVVCRFYCAKKNIKLVEEQENGKLKVLEVIKDISYESDCKDCLMNEISAGIIECQKCQTHYPIIDDIPMMLKVELRNEDIEKQFTEKWADKIKEILS